MVNSALQLTGYVSGLIGSGKPESFDKNQFT